MADQKIYGLRGLYLAELVDETATDMATMYGNLLKLNGAQSFTAAPNYEAISLEGDDKVLENSSTLMSVTVDFEHAIISTEALAIMEGVKKSDILSSDGVTKIGERLSLDTNSDGKYFGLIGFAKKDGKSVKVALGKGKCLEGLEWSLVNKEFAVVTGSAEFIAREDGMIREMLFHDTATEPVVDDFAKG